MTHGLKRLKRWLGLPAPLWFTIAAIAIVSGAWQVRVPVDPDFAIQGRASFLEMALEAPSTSDSIVSSSFQVQQVLSVSGDDRLAVGPGAAVTITAPLHGGKLTMTSATVPAHWRLAILTSPQNASRLLATRDDGAGGQDVPVVAFDAPPGTIVRTINDEASPVVLREESSLTFKVRSLDLAFTPEGETTPLFDIARPTELVFSRRIGEPNKAVQPDGSDVFGTLQEATLWIGNLPQQQPLGPINRLTIDRITHGVVRPARLEKGTLVFGARGAAGSIIDKPVSTAMNLRPRLLEAAASNIVVRTLVAVLSLLASFLLGRWSEEVSYASSAASHESVRTDGGDGNVAEADG